MRLINKSVLTTLSLLLLANPVLAEEAANPTEGRGLVALSAGILLGLAAIGGTLGQGNAISASLDAVGRNPGASGKVFTQLLLGLAFIESLVIFSFVVALQLVGKV